MNAIAHLAIQLQIATLCFATALADPNLNEKGFNGSIASLEVPTFEGTTMFVEGNGYGQAQHLGPFTYTFEFTVDLITGAGIGSAEFTAANGDSFSTEISALGLPDGPGNNRVVEEHTIVDGTGRFAGASGTITLIRRVDLVGVSTGTIAGIILLEKSK